MLMGMVGGGLIVGGFLFEVLGFDIFFGGRVCFFWVYFVWGFLILVGVCFFVCGIQIRQSIELVGP